MFANQISIRSGQMPVTCILMTGTLSLNSVTQISLYMGAQWLSGRVLDLRPKGRGFEPHRCHCIVSLSKNINPCLVLVQPRKTCPYITERLLVGRKESNQTKQSLSSPYNQHFMY